MTFNALRPIASGLTLCGLFAIAASPVSARYINHRSQPDYATCAIELLDDGINAEAAAAACATAYEPRDLSACVSRIEDNTAIAAEDALDSCREVRRPLELASCTTRIDADSNGAVPMMVLDRCRRSLLPIEFANCTIALGDNIPLGVEVAMDTCIDADDRVRDIFPTP
ncbi:MAG: hypothetical protein ACFB9N_18845 [Geitlerinemataceae cyanobacterium]